MHKRIIALDVGDRRIGVAVSDPLGITAQPVETYVRVGYGPDARRIAQFAAQYETNEVLCGLPRNMDGTEGFQAAKVREFAEKLEEQGLQVSYYDERMTTMLAERALLDADMRRDKRKRKVDMLAAVLILQSYLDTEERRDAPPPEDCAGPEEDEENEADDVLELEDERGNVRSYALTARVRVREADYVLLSALDTGRETGEDDSLILRETADESGQLCYESVEEECLIAEVYDAYLRQSEPEGR